MQTSIYAPKQNPTSRLEREQRQTDFGKIYMLFGDKEERLLCRRASIWFIIFHSNSWSKKLSFHAEIPLQNTCDSQKMQHYRYGQIWDLWQCLSSQPILVISADLPDKLRAPKSTSNPAWSLNVFCYRPTLSTEDCMLAYSFILAGYGFKCSKDLT